MKLEEAASILGVSLEDITIDGLKQTYKKLALAWDPEKCKDQNSKSKYLQISEAYKKLNSVMEGTDGYKGDDSHEIAAFMRMFMDMVGISESDSIPAAMTFGMMFGANQNTVEEWSTDEDGEGDYDDDSGDDDEDDEDDEEDDDDEEEYLPDEYFEEYAHPNSHLGGAASAAGSIHAAMKGKLNIPVVMGASWEPQVKQYSNMNLKDQLNQERLQMQLDAEDASDNEENETGELTEQEKERKLKLAKKRAEKRKKQKEKDKKKSKEQNSTDETGEEGNPENSVDYAINIKDFLDDAELNPNDLKKLIRFHTDHIITELMHAVTNGQLSRVNQILSYDFNEDVPAAVASVISLLREQLPSAPVLHQCITNLSKVTSAASNGKNTTAGDVTSSSSSNPSSAAYNTAMFTALAARRLEVARFLLNFSQPVFDLSTVDSSGLSVLHSAIVNGDLKIAQLIIKAIAQPLPSGNNTNERERKSGQLNINSRCHRQGWAPIHYAVERGDVEAVRLLAQHGANVQVTMATDKRQTPLELAKMKLKAANAANKANMQAVVEELQLAIERNKQNKEAENKAKRAELEKQQQQGASAKNDSKKTDESKANAPPSANAVPEITAVGTAAPTPAKSSTAVPATPSTDKKTKKKKDKEKAAAGPAATATPAKSVASNVSPAVSETTAPAATANTKGNKNPSTEGVVSASAPVVPAAAPASATKGKKNKKEKNGAAAGAGTTACAETPSINPIAEMSVSSRDEMVDRLLAMGFREADCLHAISLYGTDIDQAISWLCDRPAVAAPTPGKVPEEVTRPVDASPVASGHMTLAAAMAAGAAMTAPTTPGSAATLQKEKEELRRINRAWNAKAEDEKRKAEALRKQAELEKQQELLLQKQQQEVQRQQQAQQEYLYQQHLQQQQQYMALHQHQQHPHQLHSHGQPQAYFGGAHGHGWTPQQQQQQQQHAAMYGASIDPASVHAQAYPTKAGGNATSFPVGSLQHMATMLATPSGPSVNNPYAHPHAANKTGFGAHGASSSSAPPLQTLSGAMALAMEGAGVQPSLGGGLYGGLGGLSGAFPPSSSILGGANGSASGLLYKDSTSGLSGKSNNVSSASSSSWGVESLGGDVFSGNSLSNDAEHHDVIVDGALELSAGARPFVPRFGSAALGGSTIGGSASLAGGPTSARSNVSPLASPLLGPLSGSLIGGSLVGNSSASTAGGSPLTSAFGAPLSASSLGGLNLSGGLGSGLTGGLTGSPWGSSASLSMEASNNANDQQSNISNYLSNLLSTDLNLDEDNYEYGDASNIIPNLDSFLLNDN